MPAKSDFVLSNGSLAYPSGFPNGSSMVFLVDLWFSFAKFPNYGFPYVSFHDWMSFGLYNHRNIGLVFLGFFPMFSYLFLTRSPCFNGCPRFPYVFRIAEIPARHAAA